MNREKFYKELRALCRSKRYFSDMNVKAFIINGFVFEITDVILSVDEIAGHEILHIYEKVSYNLVAHIYMEDIVDINVE